MTEFMSPWMTRSLWCPYLKGDRSMIRFTVVNSLRELHKVTITLHIMMIYKRSFGHFGPYNTSAHTTLGPIWHFRPFRKQTLRSLVKTLRPLENATLTHSKRHFGPSQNFIIKSDGREQSIRKGCAVRERPRNSKNPEKTKRIWKTYSRLAIFLFDRYHNVSYYD